MYASNLEMFAHLLVIARRVSCGRKILVAVNGTASPGRLVRGVNKHDMEHMPYLDGLGSRREVQ